MEFFLIGKFEKPKDDIHQIIQQMGGIISKQIHDSLTAIISNVFEVQRMGYFMQEARNKQISVISVKFLEQALEEDPIASIYKNAICDWGHGVRISINHFNQSYFVIDHNK